MTSTTKRTGANRASIEPGRAAIVDDGQLRVSILVHLPGVLREFGCDPAGLLKGAAVDPALLADPENTIAFRTVGQMLLRAAEQTGCRHLGLLVGQRGDLSTLGVVGLLAQNSPDVGTALRSVTQHLHLHDRGAVATLEQRGELAYLGYGIYEPDVPGCDQIYVGAIAIAFRIMQGLCGIGWRPTEVLLPLRRPRDLEPYRRFFRAPLSFDADRCALAFTASWLGRPVVGADPAVRESIQPVIAALEGRQRVKIAPKVRRALHALLVTGHVSEHAVAHAFAMHRRTLNRRLKREATTFRRLLDAARFEVARQLLRDSDAPVDEIASSLGYSGPSAFGRAFRRWSGHAPQAWREHAARSAAA
jgi:AraC-like DNA-binding protein